MATDRDWAHAYKAQALADLKGADCVQGSVLSVLAMLLQMTLEKLGKAALLRSGMITRQRAGNNHQAATTMMQVIGRSRQLCRRLDLEQAYIQRTLTPMVQNLEALNPSVARRAGRTDGPWLEYPWEDPSNQVRWPERDLPNRQDFQPLRGRRTMQLLQFCHTLCDRFDSIFT